MTAGTGFTTRDIAYLERAEAPLLARIYRPLGKGPFPAIVGIHGGAWRFNDRTSNANMDSALARSGVLVIALDFGQAPARKYPLPLADINFGIRWAKANAGVLEIDPASLGAYGSSSGGHHLLLTVLRPRDPRYAALPLEGGQDATLAFAIACWPVADPLARYDHVIGIGRQSLVEAHDLYWADRDEMDEGNPVRILKSEPLGRLPPLLVIQGTADPQIPLTIPRSLVAGYQARGGDARLELFEGEAHAFANASPETAAAHGALALMADFAKRHGENPPTPDGSRADVIQP